MALTKTDKAEIERIVRKELKTFLNDSKLKKKVVDLVKDELKKQNVVDKKQVVDISSKALVELFKHLWLRRNFWETPVKNLRT